MSDDEHKERSISDKLQYWLREESDLQWVSIAVFCVVIIIGAFFFNHTNILPGWVRSDVTDQGTMVDIDWNDDGSKALAIFSNSGTKNLMNWNNENGWSAMSSDAEPNAVNWAPGLQHWLVATNDGIEVWNGIDNFSNQMAMNWEDNSTQQHRVIDVSSINGVSGFLITQSIEGSMLHYFSGTEVTMGTSPPSTGNEGQNTNDNEINESDSDDELQQIGSNTASEQGNVQLTHVEMVDSERALVIGTSSVFGINPTNALTISSLFDAWASNSENPNLQLIHSKAGIELSQISNLDGAWGDENIAAVIGPTDCLIIDFDGVVSELCEGGGTTVTIDSDGTLWISSSTNSLGIKKITYENSEYKTEELQLPKDYEINARFAKSSGDEVYFYGIDDNGNEVKATLDPSASQSVLRSMDMLGQLIVFIIAISVFGETAWQFYENRGKSSW